MKCQKATHQNTMEGDKQLRESIRANLGGWIKKLGCGGDAVEKLNYKMKFVKQLKSMPIAIKTDAANEQHYEVRHLVSSNFLL